jgi:hypothetical protein
MSYEKPQYAALVEKLMTEGKTAEQIAVETGYPLHSVELTIKAIHRR